VIDDLITWLLAQLDWQEDIARRARDADEAADRLFAGHCSPNWTLRKIDADRRLIQRYEKAAAAHTSLVSFTRGQDDGYRQACLDAIRDAAEVYADRPGYREDWRP
jgi:hypothetical protein